MRAAGIVALSGLLASASWPAAALAQATRVVRRVPSSGLASPLTPLSLANLSAPSLSAPTLSVVLSPSLNTAPPASPAPFAALPAAVEPLAARVQSALALTQSLPRIPIDSAPSAAADSFSLLTGEALVPRESDTLLAAPQPQNPETAKNVRRMMLGTAAMKSGMETVTLSVPLLALQAFGGASVVAGLVVAYGAAQAVFAGTAGGLVDRFSARKVLAYAVTAQAALVALIVGLGAAHALTAWALLPLYLLIGGAVGIVETARHSIPALILGRDGDALNKYNARLHIAYEIAGVAGALAAGALIGLAGPLWSLLLQPPAYLFAAWFFLRVRPDGGFAADAAGYRFRRALAPGLAWAGVVDKLKAYAAGVFAGAKLVLGDGRLRWVAIAFVLPQIVHRVLESLLIPIFAKNILEYPPSSAWMLTASNLGELLGAVVLLKLAARFKGPAVWVKWSSLGLLLVWSLAFSTSLPVLLPLILLSSLSWAAGDLRLRSEAQRSIAEKDQPRALSFLYGAFVLGTALTSLALGGFMDWLPLRTAFVWICAAFTALAAAVFLASRRLDRKP